MSPERAPEHIPVLLTRVLDVLEPALGDVERPVVVDGTLGLGGHAEAMLERFERLTVIGLDRDRHALAAAARRLEPFGDRAVLVHAVYDELAEVLASQGLERVNGLLFDLGVSSMQLDLAERGFSYAQDAPLDMRMNDGDDITAADILNEWSENEIARILRDYGEERLARRIAAEIVSTRSMTPFTRSSQLVAALDRAIPAPARRTGGHPAKRTFQALRIAVNDELRVWERTLPLALDALDVGGRLVVLSYHSLEDRLTKRAFADATTSRAPRDLPIVPPELEPRHRLVTRGAEQASGQERDENPRARSVRLRVVERTRP